MYPEKVKTVFKQISNDVYNQFKILINNRDIIKKDLIPLSLLFCKSSNFGKVKVFYDINSNPKFEKNENLFNFLKNTFILSILTEIFLLNNIGEIHVNIDNNEILTITENLANKFINSFFKDKSSLTNEEYLKKFRIATKEFGWIFNQNGIKKSINKDEKFTFKMYNNLNGVESDLKNLKDDLFNILNDKYIISQEDFNEIFNENKETNKKEIEEDFYIAHDSTNGLGEFNVGFNDSKVKNKNIENNNVINEDFYIAHDSTNGLGGFNVDFYENDINDKNIENNDNIDNNNIINEDFYIEHDSTNGLNAYDE
jgi:hypothetical protein